MLSHPMYCFCVHLVMFLKWLQEGEEEGVCKEEVKRPCKQGCVMLYLNQARAVGGVELVLAGIVLTLLLLGR